MTILVFGTFDGLHPGHRFVLTEGMWRARDSGGELAVVVARDANVRRIKGRLPRKPEAERMRAIAAAFPEARVLLGEAEDFLSPVRRLKPERILLGYDQRFPPNVTQEDLEALGARIERLPAFEPDKWKSSLLWEDSEGADDSEDAEDKEDSEDSEDQQ